MAIALGLGLGFYTGDPAIIIRVLREDCFASSIDDACVRVGSVRCGVESIGVKITGLCGTGKGRSERC